jgi:hypothetical protein
MRRRAFVVVSVGLVVMSVLTMSAAGGQSSRLRLSSRPSNAKFIAAARASAPHLFSIFPRVMGKKHPCVLARGWGVGGHVHGNCAMSIAIVHTPAGPEAHVSFQEVWPRGVQKWTVIELWGARARPTGRIMVVDTSWRGHSAGQLGG